MSETKFTPGERSIQAKHHGISVRAEPKPGVDISVGWFSTNITVTTSGNYRVSIEEAEANARLYAAAPDLYEDLKGLIESAHMNDYGDTIIEVGGEREAAILATLAKARGEQ